MDHIQRTLDLIGHDACPEDGLGLHLFRSGQRVTFGAGDALGQETLLVLFDDVAVFRMDLADGSDFPNGRKLNIFMLFERIILIDRKA